MGITAAILAFLESEVAKKLVAVAQKKKRSRGRPKLPSKPKPTLLTLPTGKTGMPLTGKVGRPREPKPTPKARGRPKIYDEQSDRELIELVESRKAEALKAGKRLSYSDVLREALLECGPAYYLTKGKSESEAKKLAFEAARGPHFRSLRVRLSRARSRNKDPQQ